MAFISDIAADPRVGGKARSLAELSAAGLATPGGFVVTDALFRALCARLPAFSGLDEAALERLDDARQQVMRGSWPTGFLDELHARLAGLGADSLAVRSSFAVEDAPGRLAAGVYGSRVAVARDDLELALREVLATALSPGAVAYALGHGFSPTAGPFAVLVHGYVRGDAEGSAALADTADTPAIVTVRRGALPALTRIELVDALRLLTASRGATEIEWVVTAGRLVYVQARPYQAPPAPIAWSGWRGLRPGDPPVGDWRWDAAHNPLPLSPAQAGLVELVDEACSIGIRQRVLGGYLFHAKDTRPLPTPIGWDTADAYHAELAARVLAELAKLGPTPELERALALFRSAYEPIFGVLQPALRAASAGLREFLERHLPQGLPWLPALRSGVPSVASERLARSAAIAAATTPAEHDTAVAAYLARFGDEAPTWDVAEPTYAETPERLRPGLRAPAEDDQRWRRASEAVSDRLSPSLRSEWHHRLALARTAVALGEADDWLYAKAQAAVRRALLGVARSWAGQGGLADPTDVFFVPLALVRRHADGAPPADVSTAVDTARRNDESARQNPPPSSGTGDGLSVHGIGVGGRAIGRVVWQRPGETVVAAADAVLVAQTVLPSALPLLDARALVVETGGPLDHVAAQARERRLPAVVGAAGALALLREGDVVLVDGDSGLVVKLAQG
jgi:phosphohistidine swiveling domain-containing protein